MRTKLRGKISLLFMTFGLLLAIPAVALADNIQDNVTDNVTSALQLTAGDANSKPTAEVRVVGNNAQQDPDSGCNFDTATESLTIKFNTPTGVTATALDGATTTPGEMKFTGCGLDQTVQFTASSSATAGNYTVTANVVTNGTNGTFVNQVSIPITVSPPTDTTKPVITKDVAGTLGNNGWYTTNVAVDWTVTDNESAISSQSGCTDFSVTSDQQATTYTCTATSAGGTSSDSVTIKRDATQPTNIQFVGGPNAGSESAFGSVPNEPTCTADDATSTVDTCVVSGYSNAVGTHTLTATATDKASNQATATRTYTVNKANQTITDFAAIANKTFGDDNFQVSATGGDSGEPVTFAATGDCTVSGNTVHITGAGSCTVTASQAGNNNYFAAKDVAHTFSIEKAATTTTITCGAGPFTYDGSAHTPCSAKVTGFGLNAPVTVDYQNNINAGTATAKATYTESANYKGSTDEKTFTIDKRAIEVTADNKSKTYGDADPALTYKVTSGSLATGDSLSGALTRAPGETVAGSPYAITQGTLSANSNYDLTFKNGTLTIDKRAIEVTADNKSKTYGDADPALTYKVTSGSLATGDGLSGALTREAGQDVGTYAIQQGTLSANSNYTLTYVGANLTIAQRAITVTADAKTKLLGAPDPALTYQVTSGSLVAGDSFSGALTRAPGENVGTYAITQGTLSLSGNYNLTFVGSTLKIIYKFDGFRPPVDNPGTGATPIFNSAKAGQSIPMKFSLFGNQGLDIIATGYPKVTPVTCPGSTATVDPLEEYAAVTANNGLTYDVTADQYNYVWKTQSTFANKCYKFDLVLKDGTSHVAYFKFLK